MVILKGRRCMACNCYCPVSPRSFILVRVGSCALPPGIVSGPGHKIGAPGKGHAENKKYTKMNGWEPGRESIAQVFYPVGQGKGNVARARDVVPAANFRDAKFHEIPLLGISSSTHEGKIIPLENGSFAQCLREPYGVCAAIVAWNYPFNMALYKASILLAAGNSIVMKPSSKTPINTMGLASLFTEAGLPDGVFNVVQGGSEQGSALCEHPGVDKISFTGSTPVGQKILKMAANTIKPCTLELGGKSPLIVFEDADIIPAVKAAMIANFYSAGEICTNGTRIFVHENIYDEFLAAFIQHSDALRVGDPQDPQTQIGALVDVGHADSVRDAITKAQQEGATLVTGGNEAPTGLAPHLNPLAFMRPTIFADVQDDHTLAKEEVFGPVASVFKFSDTEEVLFRANNTPYGLASGFFTRDLKRAHYVASKLQSGIVWCNTYNIYAPNVPVGGYKESGFGREFGEEALDHASHTKSVYFEMNPAAGGTDF